MSQYSVLYVRPANSADDKFAVGLAFTDSQESIFKISLEKLKVIKPLFSDDAYSLVSDTLINYTTKLNNSSSDLFTEKSKGSQINNFYSYMSDYANNHILFSKPIQLSLPVSDEIFDKLFREYVLLNLAPSKPVQKNSFVQEFKKQSLPKIKIHVNINYQVDSSIFTNVLIPFEVDFIGKNGIHVLGEAISFDKQIHHLHNDLAKYLHIVDSISDQEKDGKFYLIGQEPNKAIAHKQHDIWNSVRDLSTLDYVEYKDFDRVESYLSDKGVKPLSQIV